MLYQSISTITMNVQDFVHCYFRNILHDSRASLQDEREPGGCSATHGAKSPPAVKRQQPSHPFHIKIIDSPIKFGTGDGKVTSEGTPYIGKARLF